jgi:hypothetical protein
MNFIKTTAPIPVQELKKFFVDQDTKYLIDYKNSNLKGMKLLTYISNLEIPCNLEFLEFDSDFFDLLKDYLNCPVLVNVEILEISTITLLLEYKKLIPTNKFSAFIKDNKDIVDQWCNILDSCSLYNMYVFESTKFKDYVRSHPEAESSQRGINFVNLFSHELFYIFYEVVDQTRLRYYPGYFNDNMFRGHNLLYYWGDDANPMFMIAGGIASGLVNPDFTVNIPE